MASSRRTGTNESKWSGGAWASGVNTFGTSGASRDYTDLSVWEGDTDQDLVSAARCPVVECYRDAASFGCAVSMSGATVSATYFRIIRAHSTARHNGVPGAGIVFALTGSGALDLSFYEGSYVQDVEFVRTTNSADNFYHIRLNGGFAIGVLMHGTNSGSGGVSGINGDYGSGYMVNCIAYGMDGYGFAADGGYVYNCTAVGCTTGFTHTGTGGGVEGVFKNCIAYGCTTDFDTHGGATGTTHNLSSDATAPATGTYYRSKTLYWRDSSIDWYWLAANANAAIDRGTNLSADSTFAFDDDIAFNTRGSQWDLGAHEWQSESSRRRGINESKWTGSAWAAGVNTLKPTSGDYSGINTWETDTDVDLVAAAVCPVLSGDSGVYTQEGGYGIGDATTNAAFHRIIRAATGHAHFGVPGTGVRFDFYGTAEGGYGINEDHVALYDCALNRTFSSDLDRRVLYVETGTTGTLLAGVLLTGSNTGSGGVTGLFQYYAPSGDSCTVVNCVTHGCDVGFYTRSEGGTVLVYNCTAYGCGYGFGDTNVRSSVYKNCVGAECTTADYSVTAQTGTTHNLASDATTPESGTYYDNKTLTFANAAGRDFRLAHADWDARGKGTNLTRDAGFAFNDDLTGRLRFQWDLGAAEYCISSRRRGVNEQVSTFGDTGYGRDYTAIGTWEEATDTDLVDAAESEVLECYADAASYAATLNVGDAVASASYFRTVRAAAEDRHNGVPGAGVKFTNAGGYGQFTPTEAYASFQDLELVSAANDANDCRAINAAYSGFGVSMVGMLVKATNAGSGPAWGVLGGPNTAAALRLVNCVTYECDNVGVEFTDVAAAVSVYNCTTVNCLTGYAGTSSVSAKNCVGQDNATADYSGTFGSSGTHNLSEDATAPALGTYYRNKTLAFENVGSDIYRLANTDWDAISKGTDLSTDATFPFEDDIAWKRRNATWEVGAAMKETVTRTVYVDTDVVGGSGNGTSWANAYSGLQAALDAEDATSDLQAREECIVFLCRGAAAETNAIAVSGWTTTAWNHVTVEVPVAYRHPGKWDETKYRIDLTNPASGGVVFNVNAAYTRVVGIQIRLTENAAEWPIAMPVNSSVFDGVIDSCLIRMVLTGTAGSGGAQGIALSAKSGIVRNCIVYDVVNGANDCLGIYGSGAPTFQNNTVHNCRKGIYGGWNFLGVYQNNLVQSCTNLCYDGGFYGVAENNLSEDATSPNTVLRSKVVTFKDEAGDDFRLDATDTVAKGQGVTLAHLFTTDATGATRSVPWDIGALNYVTAAVTTVAKFFFRRLRW